MRWVIVAPLTISYLVIGMGLLVTFTQMGLPKSLWAIGIGHVVINLPLAFTVIQSQLGASQATLEQAARDLGAGELQVVFWVTLPVLWPAILPLGLFSSWAGEEYQDGIIMYPAMAAWWWRPKGFLPESIRL